MLAACMTSLAFNVFRHAESPRGPRIRVDEAVEHRGRPRGASRQSGPAPTPVEPTARPAPAAASADSPAPRGPAAHYTVVARRYRPQRFEDVVGQDHVVQALRNAIRLNRIAQAYLFCGTRGRRQDLDGPDLRQVPQLRERADRGALPGLRHLPGDRRRAGRRRDRDRRGQQQRRRAGARAAAERRRCGPAGRGTRSITSTKCTCSRPGPSTPC